MEASTCDRSLGISLSLEVNLEVTAPPRDLQHDPRSEAEGVFGILGASSSEEGL